MKHAAQTLPVIDTPRKVQHAFLVGIHSSDTPPVSVHELLEELKELTRTFGVEVVGQTAVKLVKPQPRYLLGSGKAHDIAQQARARGADVIIFDDPLTPSQQRNWETVADLTVIDRQEVILDIFAQRAHTREAELQIALARSEYDLPRLKRRWTHLSRQRSSGGATLRGEGEQQIEVDARLVQQRIAHLKRELADVVKKRKVQRKKRFKRPIPNAALVGYTNAGKSSLLNALTGAGIFTENKLFATLDPTTRRLVLPNRQELLISDTVGFIRKLPHSLIEAFKATLEEATMADFIIEVIDATSPDVDEHHRTTQAVLDELGIHNKYTITVFNKTDLIENSYDLPRLRRRFGNPVFVSAKTGHGINELIRVLAAELNKDLCTVELAIPHDRYDVVALLHRTSNVVTEKNTDCGTNVIACVPTDILPAIQKFVQ